jgi:hypothetical protein
MKKFAIATLILSIIVAILPLVSMFVAGFFAHIFGCTLNEADVSVCPTVFGDIGGMLSLMALFGWLVFYTVPLGCAGILISILFFTISAFKAKKDPTV